LVGGGLTAVVSVFKIFEHHMPSYPGIWKWDRLQL